MSSSALALPGQKTLLASWAALAQLSPGARLIRSTEAAAAVFPSWAPLNNAITLNGAGGAAVATALTSLYAEAGVDVWALWVPTRVVDLDVPDDLGEVNGMKRDTTTLVMQATMRHRFRLHAGVVRTSIAAASLAGDEPVLASDLGEPERLPGLDGWAMVHEGVAVAGAWSFVHGSDCGIYAVETLPGWRRRGLARALMEHVLAYAQRRGARTASLQSTRMGQLLYASLGFEPVGRYEEWISQ